MYGCMVVWLQLCCAEENEKNPSKLREELCQIFLTASSSCSQKVMLIYSSNASLIPLSRLSSRLGHKWAGCSSFRSTRLHSQLNSHKKRIRKKKNHTCIWKKRFSLNSDLFPLTSCVWFSACLGPLHLHSGKQRLRCLPLFLPGKF